MTDEDEEPGIDSSERAGYYIGTRMAEHAIATRGMPGRQSKRQRNQHNGCEAAESA